MIGSRLGRITTVVILFFFAVLWGQDTATAESGKVRPEMIVSTRWLAEHLNDPKVVVLHVAEKLSDYDAGHIPGARLLLFDDFMVDDDAELPPPEKLKEAFEKLGVSNDSRVVVYTTSWYPMAGRAYYTLDYLGHGDHTALLDGGIDEWKLEKRPLEKDSPKITRGSFTLHIHPEVRAMLEDVKKLSEQPTQSELLVDSRPEKRYTDGHISGAVHVYWQETLVDAKNKPTFLPPDKLKELFASRGIKPGQKLVTYCEIGLQASHDYFIAKYLGYDAAMFDGSIHQWSHMNNLPLVKGESLR
ncbi:MAG TPA: sulfurtransferase [Candidatus Angelobacter sp.]|nr:sulfurtransferase [Candidatus Angelobacter sp.]